MSSINTRSNSVKIVDDDEFLPLDGDAGTSDVNCLTEVEMNLIPLSLSEELREFLEIIGDDDKKNSKNKQRNEAITVKANLLKNVLDWYLEFGEKVSIKNGNDSIACESKDSTSSLAKAVSLNEKVSLSVLQDEDYPKSKRRKLLKIQEEPPIQSTSFTQNVEDEALKKRSFAVSDYIIKPLKAKENTCIFYSMFNALRTSELRVAFAGGPFAVEDDPALNFKTKIWSMDESFRARSETIGYNEWDMIHYLDYLKHQHIIKGYTFNRFRDWKPSKVFRVPKNDLRPMNLLLCGVSPDRVSRERGKKSIEKAMSQHDSHYCKMLAGVTAYQKFSDQYKDTDRHGVGLTIEEGSHDVYIYDTVMQKRQVCTIPLLCYIVDTKYVYQFELIL